MWVFDCNSVSCMSYAGGPPWWYRHRSSCHDHCPSHHRLTQLLWLSTATWEILGPFHLPVPPQWRIDQLVALLSTPPCTCHGKLSLALWQTQRGLACQQSSSQTSLTALAHAKSRAYLRASCQVEGIPSASLKVAPTIQSNGALSRLPRQVLTRHR